MAIRKLLLPLSGTPAGEAALATALMAARHWEAHLEALHVRADSRDVAQLAGEGMTGTMVQEMMNAAERESGRRAQAARAMFDRFLAAHGVAPGPARPGQDQASAAFMEVTGRADDLVARQARLADLAVVPHPEADEDVTESDALHAVLFDSGRPVLISPREAPAVLCGHLCLAWSGTAESAAAARFAIPWMQRAQAVTVLHSPDYQRHGPAAGELADYLALHGITARLAGFAPVGREVGAGLLAGARAQGADMLAMGAYSSSRLRQLILGGVTRHVLEHATLPVLMCR